MDSYEATKIVFSRIQSLDPDNATKIMGFILIQDQGEKEMIRLALGSETHLHQLILQAKSHLGLPVSSSSPPSPSPISRPISRISTNGLFITNPSSPSSNPWTPSSFSDSFSPSNPPSSLSYASIVNGTSNSVSVSSSAFSPFYKSTNSSETLVDDYQLQDHLSFLNDSKSDDLFDPRVNYGDNGVHKRSYSVPGVCFGSEDVSSGFGWKPCLYFARGFCKNGSSCRFLHGGCVDSSTTAAIVGSPNNFTEFEQCEELLRSKAAEQQKQTQFMAAGVSHPFNKSMNFLQNHNDSQRSGLAPLMVGDELPEFGPCRLERNEFSAMGLGGMMNPGSRQIYLTFTADSTFREEDVSNYFSIYGPVQDVRIPYQQKRMFGFVTFVYPETVKLILAKGNPHFVCDSRVLVKPYKEKGKVPESFRKQHHQNQQLELGEYTSCTSPAGVDSREPFDLGFGARMLYNTQEMMLRRKLEEQADLQQAIELQGRRLMNLQFLEFKNQQNRQFQHGFSAGSPIPSPTLSHNNNNKTHEFPEDSDGSPPAAISQIASGDANHLQLQKELNAVNTNGQSNSKEESANSEPSYLHESLEHILPDSLFVSPKKSAGDIPTVFSMASADSNEITSSTTSSSSNNNPLLPPMSTLNMASLKSCFLQLPRLSSGSGTIGM